MKDRQHGLNPQQIRDFLAGWHPFCSRTDLFAGYGGFVTATWEFSIQLSEDEPVRTVWQCKVF